MPAQNVAVKVVVTPLLIGGASLAGRRLAITQAPDGLLLGLPAPAAFFLVLALTLPPVGPPRSQSPPQRVATAAAFGPQGITMLAIPQDRV